MPLHPLPESYEALSMLGRGSGRDLTAELISQGDPVEDVVPNLVGMSLALVREDLTFTIAATVEHLAMLDAIQYAFGGPCVDAALQDSTVFSGDSETGLLDEQRWVQFARAGAAHGVLSTLSLPVHGDGRVIGSVNLHAATPSAFAGKEERVAAVLGAWAPGAVHNADLSFSAPEAARRAPGVLEDVFVMARATGVAVAAQAVNEASARRIIADSARLAGVDEAAVARELIRPYLRDGEPL